MKKAIDTIKNGGIILHQTDTIWGLGADATNIESIKKVYSIKNRKINNPLIILVNNVQMLKKYVTDCPDNILNMINKIGGVITIIYPNPKNLPQILIQKNSIAIRITRNKTCKSIITKINKPMVSTSANISGDPYPKKFSEINKKIKNAVDYILEDSNKESISNPSCLYRLNKNEKLEYINR